MAEIEKLRVLHDLKQQFEVPKQTEDALCSQLSDDDRSKIERFMGGFKIENWFESIFSVLPWSILVHGLSQRQFPSRSKNVYQVPDFLAFVETSSLNHQPIFVEVKSVTGQKQTLELQESQVTLTQNYARRFGLPHVYAVYWEKFNAWTINTTDSFEIKTKSRKLSLIRAIELDCSLIIGDVSFLISKSLKRVLIHTSSQVEAPAITHPKYGTLVSDILSIAGQDYELNAAESAALDSVLSWRRADIKKNENTTTIVQEINENYLVKLSTWITRHLAIFQVSPDELNADVSALVIFNLTKRLGIPHIMHFPEGHTEEIKLLDKMCFQKTNDK